MYRIIGADRKEYGPVSAEQLRQWVTEGRLNAQSQARAEGETEWRPLASFPEFSDLLQTVPAATPAFGAGASGAPAEVVLGRDYDLDIGSCISRAWDLVRRDFWPVIGISLLIGFIALVINQVLGLATSPVFKAAFLQRRPPTPGGLSVVIGVSLLSSPIYTLLMAGLFKYYLKLVRSEAPTIADAFSGFSPLAGQLILLGLVNSILTLLASLLCLLPGIYLSVSWVFALPLVIDRHLPFWDAMELSRKVVTRHWFIVFGFLLVVGLVIACGVFACCIGVVVSVPVGLVAIMYAYEDIFGQKAA